MPTRAVRKMMPLRHPARGAQDSRASLESSSRNARERVLNSFSHFFKTARIRSARIVTGFLILCLAEGQAICYNVSSCEMIDRQAEAAARRPVLEVVYENLL